MYQIPILFIVFNRLETALKSFEVIRSIQPNHLYIASDAARTYVEGEDAVVAEVRNKIMDNITWKCNVKTLFQKTNLGCGNGVYTAINWFFENEKYGIILEDDCIASPSFFLFAEKMILKYEHDQRIGMIAGTNPINMSNYDYSYIFSKYKSCWGWATWKRAWVNMDMKMDWVNKDRKSVLLNSGYCGKDYSNWKYKIKYINKGYVSAWDWQWYFSLAAQNQLCIYPKVNLISNIGNDKNATHTAFGNISLTRCELDFPLHEPPYVLPNALFDKKFYRDANSFVVLIKRLLPFCMKKKIKNVIIYFKNLLCLH